MDMMRCMLYSKYLYKFFQAEAIACAIYMVDRCPTKGIFGKATLHEAWNGRKLNTGHMN